MDDLIITYISTSYNADMQSTLLDAIRLLDSVEFIEHLDPLNNLIMSEDLYHDIDINLGVIGIIQRSIDDVLKMHTITCNTDTPLSTRVDILNSLIEVQSLLDYQTLLNFLRSDANDDDKLISIIQATSILTEIQICDAIGEYDSKIIQYLIDLLEKREESVQHTDTPEEIELQSRLIKRLHVFSETLDDYTMLGNGLIESGFMIGKPIMNYMPFVKEYWSQLPTDTIAKHIVSLILISQEGLDNPLMVFRKYSTAFTSDPSYILRLDTEISNLNSLLQRKLTEKGVQ